MCQTSGMSDAASTDFTDGEPDRPAPPSPRKTELLERAYRYALEHGIAGISLRPLAAAIDSSPRVLLFLFGSKEELVRALLARARAEELALLERLRAGARQPLGLAVVVEHLWEWLAAEQRCGLLKLWVEGYARSLIEPDGPWAGFAVDTVEDWLDVLAAHQPPAERDTEEGRAMRTEVLALLRGTLLDLLATGDRERTTAAVRMRVRSLRARE
ncbi:transcriptional regulator [Saccharomonospora marina XMU15]|uniref:Transcriptional regulator n=2 Tax=Saccharomonospora TaxID=1851 RepID=H5WXS8_9PSEU|nr:transcriptional regulator [Saccharomonospora marina XMU15]